MSPASASHTPRCRRRRRGRRAPAPPRAADPTAARAAPARSPAFGRRGLVEEPFQDGVHQRSARRRRARRLGQPVDHPEPVEQRAGQEVAGPRGRQRPPGADPERRRPPVSFRRLRLPARPRAMRSGRVSRPPALAERRPRKCGHWRSAAPTFSMLAGAARNACHAAADAGMPPAQQRTHRLRDKPQPARAGSPAGATGPGQRPAPAAGGATRGMASSSRGRSASRYTSRRTGSGRRRCGLVRQQPGPESRRPACATRWPPRS